jgi:hypothetical protein
MELNLTALISAERAMQSRWCRQIQLRLTAQITHHHPIRPSTTRRWDTGNRSIDKRRHLPQQ